MRHRTTLGLVALLAIAGAACGSSSSVIGKAATGGGSSGGDSRTTEGKAYVDAMTSSFQVDGSGITPTDARCIAGVAVDVVTVKTLKAAGVTPENVANTSGTSKGPFDNFKPTEQQANGIVDGIFKCVDFGQLMVQQLTGSQTSLPFSVDKVKCLGVEMAKSPAFKDYIKASMLNTDTTAPDAGIQKAVLPLFDKCKISLGDLANLGS